MCIGIVQVLNFLLILQESSLFYNSTPLLMTEIVDAVF